MNASKNLFGLVGWLAVSFAAAWVGSRYMPGAWYVSLSKPSWNPPNYVFAPIWTVLYVLMSISAWLIWLKAGIKGANAGLVLFVLQLILNALWSYLFFGLHRPGLAFFDIVALWLVILAVAVLFWRVDHVAGGLMVPYIAWVSFATYLNFVLWRLNPGTSALP
jgi:translocator protein